MASRKSGHRKRKSAGVCDIFEVNEKDLSPEPTGPNNEEPEAKVQKTMPSDVSESRKSKEFNKSSPKGENVNHDVKESSANALVPETNSSSIILLDEDDSISAVEIICVEEYNSKGDTDILIINDSVEDQVNADDVHTLQDKYTQSEADNLKVSTVSDESSKVFDGKVCTRTEDCTEVISISENDVECIDTTERITIHPESTNDNLEDGEVHEPDTSSCIQDPVITVQFKDRFTSDSYKHKFLKLIQSFVELNPKVSGNMIEIFRDESINPKDWVVLDDTVCIKNESDEEILAERLPITPRNDSPKKRKKRKKSQSMPEMFVVDTQPALLTNKQLQLTKYSTKFSIDDGPDEVTTTNKPTSSSLCFNCEQQHALKDCPFPKHFGKISANRQKFQNKNKSSRYHLEEDHKFSHLKPGKPSNSLRKALGLKKHQIPEYVYRMRVMGYPPGWLEEAQYVSSDLAMFDIDGNNVRNTSIKKVHGLNPEKVVDYSGFNVPFEKGFRDEYKYYRVPPFSDNFSKENMIDVFNKMAECEGAQDNIEPLDMDVDSVDLLSEATNMSEIKKTGSSVDSDSNDPSISLQELEKQKNSLLEEIKKANETVPWDQPSDDTNTSTAEEKSDVQETTSKQNDEENNRTTDTPSKRNETDVSGGQEETIADVLDKNTSENANSVKCSVFGTPIIKSCSPFNRLPNPDNFMKGVSPVIDFENLPNSTGKYEQMTGVLQKVRNTLKGLQKSDT